MWLPNHLYPFTNPSFLLPQQSPLACSLFPKSSPKYQGTQINIRAGQFLNHVFDFNLTNLLVEELPTFADSSQKYLMWYDLLNRLHILERKSNTICIIKQNLKLKIKTFQLLRVIHDYFLYSTAIHFKFQNGIRSYPCIEHIVLRKLAKRSKPPQILHPRNMPHLPHPKITFLINMLYIPDFSRCPRCKNFSQDLFISSCPLKSMQWVHEILSFFLV